MRLPLRGIVAFLALAAFVPSPGAAGPVATFALHDAGATGSELNLGVAPNGHIFVGGWDKVVRSADDGATWTALSAGFGLAADRVMTVDHATGRVIVEDTDLACTLVYWSDNDGASFTSNPGVCLGSTTDHAKVAVGPRVAPLGANPMNLLYRDLMWVCANGLSNTGCAASPDGGITWLPSAPHGVGCAFQGEPVIGSDGTLYEPSSACGLQVRKSADAGRSWTELTAPSPRFVPSNDVPGIAITSDGTLYVLYTNTARQPQLARSANGGLSWDGPFAVAAPGLTSALFPVIVGGAAGKVALAYYGTTDMAVGWDKNPGNAPATVRWNAYAAIVTDANAPLPSVTPVQLTPAGDPLQYGCLSKLGACLNNIADYIDIDVGPDGRAYVVLVDGCLPGCTSALQSTSDEAVIAVQTGGPTLL